jgi:hypothetical protein
VTIRWTTTDQAARTSGAKVLVYGPAGIGKTRLCATMPPPVVIASAEAGLMSLRQRKDPVAEIHSYADVEEFYRWCTQSAESRQFPSVCIDSITEIADVLLTAVKRNAKDPRQAYGEMLERMIPMLRGFRDIQGKHVYFSAQMEYSKDDATGVSKWGPSMPGTKLGPKLPYLFDEVFRMGTAKTPQGVAYTFLQTQVDFQYEAKDRSGSLASVETPDLSAVISKILGA